MRAWPPRNRATPRTRRATAIRRARSRSPAPIGPPPAHGNGAVHLNGFGAPGSRGTSRDVGTRRIPAGRGHPRPVGPRRSASLSHAHWRLPRAHLRPRIGRPRHRNPAPLPSPPRPRRSPPGRGSLRLTRRWRADALRIPDGSSPGCARSAKGLLSDEPPKKDDTIPWLVIWDKSEPICNELTETSK